MATYNQYVPGFLKKVVSTAADGVNTVTQFFSGTELIPDPAAIAMALWGIAAGMAVITFIIYWVLFRVGGINPFGSVGTFFLSATLLILGIMPIVNIFPWIELWVFLMLFMGTFSSISLSKNK